MPPSLIILHSTEQNFSKVYTDPKHELSWPYHGYTNISTGLTCDDSLSYKVVRSPKMIDLKCIIDQNVPLCPITRSKTMAND